jgi:carboxyl-terminal processing protease
MKNIFRICLAAILLVSFSLPAASIAKTDAPPAIDTSRNKLIGYILSKQLPVIHFSDKVMSDSLF